MFKVLLLALALILVLFASCVSCVSCVSCRVLTNLFDEVKDVALPDEADAPAVCGGANRDSVRKEAVSREDMGNRNRADRQIASAGCNSSILKPERLPSAPARSCNSRGSNPIRTRRGTAQ